MVQENSRQPARLAGVSLSPRASELTENIMMENKVQELPGSNSPTTPRLDLLGFATLVGVVGMLAIAAVNIWNVSRLAERVAKIEAAIGGPRRSGPDPS